MHIALLASGYRVVTESFNRADHASSLGIADSQQAWSTQAGTWGITGNKAYQSLTTNSDRVVTLDSGIQGASDIRVKVVWNAGEKAGIAFRAQDASTGFIFFIDAGGGYSLGRKLPSYSVLGTNASGPATNGQTLEMRVILNGTSITCFANNSQKFSLTDPNFTTVSRHGLFFNPAASGTTLTRFDDFSIDSI